MGVDGREGARRAGQLRWSEVIYSKQAGAPALGLRREMAIQGPLNRVVA